MQCGTFVNIVHYFSIFLLLLLFELIFVSVSKTRIEYIKYTHRTQHTYQRASEIAIVDPQACVNRANNKYAKWQPKWHGKNANNENIEWKIKLEDEKWIAWIENREHGRRATFETDNRNNTDKWMDHLPRASCITFGASKSQTYAAQLLDKKKIV